MTSQLQHSLIRLENFQKLTELQHDLIGIDNLTAPGRVSASAQFLEPLLVLFPSFPRKLYFEAWICYYCPSGQWDGCKGFMSLSLSELHGGWDHHLGDILRNRSEMLLLKLWLQFHVCSTDTGYTGCSVCVSCWKSTPSSACVCLVQTQRTEPQHWAELVWVPLYYRSLSSSYLAFCFFGFDRCTEHKY